MASKPQADTPASAPTPTKPKTDTPDAPTTRWGRVKERAGNMRDAAFSKLEISDDSRASQRTQKVMKSVEEWFAGGAGGWIGNKKTTADAAPPTKTTDAGDAPAATKKPQAGGDADPPIRSHADAKKPISQMSDAEMAAMTKTHVKVGDVDHDVSVRRKSETKVECEICSRACGPVKQKIEDINTKLNENPGEMSQAIKGDLDKLSTKVKNIEDKIEGREIQGVYQAGEQVIKLAGDIADDFHNLGVKYKTLGEAIDTPDSILKDLSPEEFARIRKELFPLSGGGPDSRIDTSKLASADQLSTSVPRFPVTEFRTHMHKQTNSGRKPLLGQDQQAVYVLRDKNGVVLKVGKTNDSNFDGRFAKYAKAANAKPELGLTLEVTFVKKDASKSKKQLEKAAEDIEREIRLQLEKEGHIMPWDNTNNMRGSRSADHEHDGRLNRPGPAVPLEPPYTTIKVTDPDTGTVKKVKSKKEEHQKYKWDESDFSYRLKDPNEAPPKWTADQEKPVTKNMDPKPQTPEELRTHISNLAKQLHQDGRVTVGGIARLLTNGGARVNSESVTSYLNRQGLTIPDLLAMQPKPKPQSKPPLKNKSGDLNDAARAARNQPYYDPSAARLPKAQADANLAAPNAAKPIELGGSKHTVAAKRTDNGDVIITLCSVCTRMSTILKSLEATLPEASSLRPQLKKLANEVDAMESLIQSGSIAPDRIPDLVSALATKIKTAATEYPAVIGDTLGKSHFDPATVRAREQARINDPVKFAKVEEHLGKPVPPLPAELQSDYIMAKNGGIRRRSPKEDYIQLTNRNGTLEVVPGKVKPADDTTTANDPLQDPKVSGEIQSDPTAIYGYSPLPQSSLAKFNIDFTSALQVSNARQQRIQYLENLRKKRIALEADVETKLAQGMTMEQIARQQVGKRNKGRMQIYIDAKNLEGLQKMKERNLQKYQREEGPTPDQLFEKYGSWEGVLFGSVSTSRAMSVILGLD